MKTAFVILHYNAIKETHKCIQYIKENIDTQDYKILVMDNASPNHSGEILQEQYAGYYCISSGRCGDRQCDRKTA